MEDDKLITDQISLAESGGISKDGKLDICLITPGWGSSGYYSESVLREAATEGIFSEGSHQYWDHPTWSENMERPERSLRDLAGKLMETATWKDKGWNGPGIYAKTKVFKPFSEALEDPDFLSAIGISIRATGVKRHGEAEGESGEIVDKITGCKSVDFVTLPGRGGKIKGLFESLRESRHQLVESETRQKREEEERRMDELQEARKQLRESEDKIRELQESQRTLTERAETAERERDEAREAASRSAEALVLREAKDEVADYLDDDKIEMPDVTKKRLIESLSKNPPVTEDGQLDKAKFETVIEEAVKAEATYLASVGATGKVRGVGNKDIAESLKDESDDDDIDEADLDARLSKGFGRMGLSESAVKIAANGRGN